MHTSITRTVFQTTVFSDGPRGGNPCPVVLDADELSTQQGMSLAEKFTAESIFITTAKNPRYDFGLRYFVPHHEMEMCVHGTIAAVTVLRALERITSSPVQVETVLGQITVEWLEQDENLVVTVHQFAPDFSAQNPSNVEVCEVLRLPDISSIRRDLPIISVSTSRHKLIVPLDSVQRLDRLLPDFEALWSLCDRFNTTGLYTHLLLTQQRVKWSTPQGSFRDGPVTMKIPQLAWRRVRWVLTWADFIRRVKAGIPLKYCKAAL